MNSSGNIFNYGRINHVKDPLGCFQKCNQNHENKIMTGGHKNIRTDGHKNILTGHHKIIIIFWKLENQECKLD